MSPADAVIEACRPLPELSPWTRPFWTGGEQGELRLPRCTACGRRAHPSQTVCRDCCADLQEWAAVSGRGVVVGVTVNHQPFVRGFTPPYVIAVVALDDTDGVRLTTNLLVEPDQARVGQRVGVRFHEQDGVWFPLFAPSDEPDAPTAALVPPPQVVTRTPATSSRFEDRIAITGLGMSQVGRRLGR